MYGIVGRLGCTDPELSSPSQGRVALSDLPGFLSDKPAVSNVRMVNSLG
jgi:hypothetical protein